MLHCNIFLPEYIYLSVLRKLSLVFYLILIFYDMNNPFSCYEIFKILKAASFTEKSIYEEVLNVNGIFNASNKPVDITYNLQLDCSFLKYKLYLNN